ncbi:MAG: hypothetical protein COV35_04535 [Alphaproteobacteria bacterium CG11_big_fil_rev_8_21_14_0_20_39_49]|nr:MAG: hypothetical protein COV35_04535 [Alphaproteobacteria bacterium CG11_big_fil_rev_8_21_14_0_20_39_49]
MKYANIKTNELPPIKPLLDKEEFDSLAMLEQNNNETVYSVEVSSIGLGVYDVPTAASTAGGANAYAGLVLSFILWLVLFLKLLKKRF